MNLCTGGGSLGLIDIAGGPIRWVNVRSVGEGDYVAEYGVPCEHAPVPNPRLTSVRVRTFPLLGSMVDVRWRGYDPALLAGRSRRRRRHGGRAAETTGCRRMGRQLGHRAGVVGCHV